MQGRRDAMTDHLRVMVTAAGSGIGRAIALAFANAGAIVHTCDADEALLGKAASESPEIAAKCVDVTDEAALGGWFDEVLDSLGGLDVLVNNAGIAGPTAAIEDTDYKDWQRCLAVGVDSQFLTCRRAVPVMKHQGAGSIINISSTAGLYGLPYRTPYATAKWGVIGFTKSLAAEVGRWNIRVNAICPGAVEGARMERVIAAEAKASGRTAEAIRADYTQGVSLKRFVKPEEIAAMALFLASPQASMISGQALTVDGHTETFHSE
jgi:NAD(P)-dependent dehydrogenase (short-subunit alcohol dehydrogenase family)